MGEWDRQLTGYHNQEILQLIRYGFPIECDPRLGTSEVPDNHKGAQHYPQQIHEYIQQELDKRSMIGPFDSNPFGNAARFSLMNTREKKESSDRRVILDLSWPQNGAAVNQGIDKAWYRGKQVKCTLPSVYDLVQLVLKKGQGCRCFKRDLKKFYKQIIVCIGEIHLLGYVFDKKIYFDLTLPMGLVNSAYIAQSVTSSIVFIYEKEGYAAVNYLDDLGGAEQQYLAEQAYQVLALILQSLGVQESIEKACPPTMWVIFLGILINTYLMRLEITPDRMKEIIEELEQWQHRHTASVRQVQSLIGKLSFCTFTMRAGRQFYSRILNFLRETDGKVNPHKQVILPQTVFQDIQWWRFMIQKVNGISMIPDSKWVGPNRIISSDACLTGIGAWSQGDYLHTRLPQWVIKQGLDINTIECLAVMIALKHWAYRLNGVNTLWQCDNRATVDCVNRGRARNKYMQALLREIAYLCVINDCDIKLVYVPGNSNRISDSLSRWHMSIWYEQQFYKLTRGLKIRETLVKPDDFKFSNAW